MLVCVPPHFVSKDVPRRAVLIFAHPEHIDLAQRAFPGAARRLLRLPTLDSELLFDVDVHLFTTDCVSASGAKSGLHRQSGRNFASRLENAIERIAQLGYDEVVAVGRDCPSLRASDIERAFTKLESNKLVLGPDHRGGCYLIAFRSADRKLLRDIRWKQNTDCIQLRKRCEHDQVFLLSVKHDLDSWADIRTFSRSGDPLARFAIFLLGLISAAHTRLVHFVSVASQQMRVRQQMPPPAFTA